MSKRILQKICVGLVALVCAFAIIPTISTAFNSQNEITCYAAKVTKTETINGTSYTVNQLSGYPILKQDGRYNCWQYAMRSVTLYKHNYSSSAYEFFLMGGNYYVITGQQPFDSSVSNANGDPNVLDIPLHTNAYTYFMQSYFGSSVRTLNRRATYSEIISSIDNDKPISIHLKNSASGIGHTIIAYGYALKANSTTSVEYIKCMEPASGQSVYIQIPNNIVGNTGSVKYNRFDGNIYTWTQTTLM